MREEQIDLFNNLLGVWNDLLLFQTEWKKGIMESMLFNLTVEESLVWTATGSSEFKHFSTNSDTCVLQCVWFFPDHTFKDLMIESHCLYSFKLM